MKRRKKERKKGWKEGRERGSKRGRKKGGRKKRRKKPKEVRLPVTQDGGSIISLVGRVAEHPDRKVQQKSVKNLSPADQPLKDAPQQKHIST